MNLSDNQLRTLVKAAGIAALGVTALVIGVRVVKRIRENKGQKELSRAVNSLTTTDSQAAQTITADQAKLFANTLFEAFNVWNGTDTDAVRSVIAKLHNGKDWLAVIKAFGVKPYGTTGTPWFGDGTQLDLMGWFRKELSGSLLKDIESRVEKYGINI